jgi:hypothetical protein
MGRNRKDLSTTSKISGQLTFGALVKVLPRKVVDEHLAKAGRKEQRSRALPARLMVYYTLAMCAFSQIGVEEVLRWVLEQAREMCGLEAIRVASAGAISSARKRLGSKVLEQLYRKVVTPLAVKETKGAWYRGLRLMALDGSTLDLQDTKANAAHYGYAKGGRGECAFPKLRFVALVEVGTRALLGARMGAFGTSEKALAEEVLGSLSKGMLCMADRLFYSFEFWQKALKTGAQLLWRVKNNTHVDVEKSLSDGSWLTTLREQGKGKKSKGVQVRVIRYRLVGENAPDEEYLLLTTLLDSEQYPAPELACLYTQRWEIELAYDEFKTHLHGGAVVLRSKTPELVEQEFYAFLLMHFCARSFMHEAALANEIDPDELSFKHTVEVLKRKFAAAPAAFPPCGPRAAPPEYYQGNRRGSVAPSPPQE